MKTMTHGGECILASTTVSGWSYTTPWGNFATPWDSHDAPWNWFKTEDSYLKVFCGLLVDKDVLFGPGEPTDDSSPGECISFTPRVAGGTERALGGLGITVTVSWDALGCEKNDEYMKGVNIKKWGETKCRNTIWDNVVKKCREDHIPDDLKVPKGYDNLGGVFFQDCMRFVVVAVQDNIKPPDTLFNADAAVEPIDPSSTKEEPKTCNVQQNEANCFPTEREGPELFLRLR